MRGRRIISVAGVALAAMAILLGFRGRAATPAAAPAAGSDAEHGGGPSRSADPSPTAEPQGPPSPPRFAEEIDVSTFQKGNIHTHSNWSDGDRPPEYVYRWYRARGYAFLAVTDHNHFTDPAQFRHLERRRAFVMIPGEEITMMGAGRQVHVNALCIKHMIAGPNFATAGEALAFAAREVAAQGGVALVNHPNFDWGLVAGDLPSAQGARLLEIASGHPFVHTDGDETHLSHEAIWDTALSNGQLLAGVAVDDAHTYGRRPKDSLALPGRAWIEVFADVPERKAICAALAAGRLYASTGVKLRRIVVKDDTYGIAVTTPGVEVEFIGQNGVILSRAKPGDDKVATYKLRGGEGYVRARITASNGKRAWTQAAQLVR